MWHGVSGTFQSPSTLRARLQESFPHDVPSTTDFQLGYLEGNTKRWIVEKKDLDVTYSIFQPCSKITLWCDAKIQVDDEPAPKKRKRDGTSTCKPSSDSSEVDSVDLIFKKLKNNHPDMLGPKLRLWAKMIDKGRHDDYNNPPQIPLITGSPVTAKKKSSTVADALASAATVIASAFQSPSRSTPQKTSSRTTESGAKFSPMSGAKLRRSCLDDLKLMKELYQDAVVSEAEFSEQKVKILCTLKELN